MYSVAIRRDFVGQHQLVGGDWGRENQWHSHHYQVEVLLEGTILNQHGFLVDITDIEAHMHDLIARFRDKSLNEHPEFSGLNPSIEHFSRIFCDALVERIKAPNLSAITTRIWEDQVAWASYRRELNCGSA